MFNRETGKPIAIKDEGVTVIDSAASLDFTGIGVSATAVGDDVTTNIPGASAIGINDLTDVSVSSPTSGQILSYNGSAWANSSETGLGTVTSVSVATANGVSGTVATATTTPVITLTLGAITPSSVQVSGLTASELLATDASKNLVSLAVGTYPSLTELAYVKGVTSAIQTQLGNKQASDAGLTSLAGLTYASTSFVKMTGADTFALDTNTYLTSLSGAVLTDQSTPQTIGLTGARLAKLWATDIEVTNAIAGSVTGNAATVTNATLTTALTVNTGTVTLTGNVAGSVLTIGAGAVSVSGTNTGDNTVATSGDSPTDFFGAGSSAYVTAGTDVALADGGTNASLAASTGGIVYSGASALAILAGTATAGQLLLSGATAAPTWSTTTYPSTNAVSTLLYASSANVMAALATANSGILNTSAAGVPSITATPIIGTSLQVGIAGTSLGSLKIAGNTSGVITLTAAAAAGTYTLTLPTTDGDASQVLTTDGAGILSWTTAAGGGSATEVMAEISAQVNVSSAGDVYTDTSGDTYAETTNQTRMTLTSSRTRYVIGYVSYHVNAGTGTIQLWNFTDSASLATATTTNVSETGKSFSSNHIETNNGDAITLRVKNSGAGNTVTIDQGGMMEGDGSITLSTMRQYSLLFFDTSSGDRDARFYPTTASAAILKFVSTTTFSGAQFSQGGKLFGSRGEIVSDFGTTFDQTAAGTVITGTPTVKSGVIALVTSAQSGSAAAVVSFNLKADDI